MVFNKRIFVFNDILDFYKMDNFLNKLYLTLFTPKWLKFISNHSAIISDSFPEKSSCYFGFCPNYLDPLPLTPIWTTCTTFSQRRNSRFEIQFKTKNTRFGKNLKESIFLRRTSLTSNRAPMVPKTDILTKNTQNDKNHWICHRQNFEGPPAWQGEEGVGVLKMTLLCLSGSLFQDSELSPICVK